jgi:hypothetical protein
MISKDDHPVTDLTRFTWTINESLMRVKRCKKYHPQFLTNPGEIEHHTRRVIGKLYVTKDREA